MQGKKFISPEAWFSMIYPSAWSEFEDGEGSFLFYNPDNWTGNFRISAYKIDASSTGNGMKYGMSLVQRELDENSSATLVTVGPLKCAYSKEMFQEDGTYYTTHIWIAGIDNVAFECSFTVAKGGDITEAEKVIESLAIRKDGQKYPAELIPIRLCEVFEVNEAYEWVVETVKKQQKKDFQGIEEDLPKIQELIDNGELPTKKRDPWLALGITVCAILANEVEGMEWMTLIDGNREAPVLCYKDSGKMIDPMKLVWSKIKAGEPCNVVEEYKNVMSD
ncbi:DUF3805 domain-containing protein [Bacteroides sp.]